MPSQGEKLSDFELERQRRIQENKQRMAELGLLQASQALKEACEGEAKPAKRAPVKPRQRELRLVEVRRSGRERRMPENFTYREEDRPAATREPASRKRKACLVVRTYSSVEAGWKPSMGEASEAAADRAFDAAEELAEALENWTCIKRMTFSQVASGFWCSAPATMAVALKRTNRADKSQVVKLVLGKRGQQQEGAAAAGEQAEGEGEGEEEERSWDAIWLPHGKSSWGFSGGWRGFAIDQELYPSDAVLYEVLLPDTPGQPSDTVRIYIFRAFDYETPAMRDEIKAKAAAAAVGEEEEEIEQEKGEEGGSLAEEGEAGEQQAQQAQQPRRQSGDGVGMSGGREPATVEEGLLRLGSQGQEPAAAAAEQAEGRPAKRQKKQATMQAVAATAAATAAAKGGAAGKPAAESKAQQGKQGQGKGLGSNAGGKDGGKAKIKASSAAAAAATVGAPGSKRQSSAGGGGSGKQAGKQKQEKSAGGKGSGSKSSSKGSGSSKAGGKGDSGKGDGGKGSSKAELKQKGKVEEEEGEEEGPPPATEEGGYYVEKIVGARWRNGKPQYLIKWWGYDEVTWEPMSNLDAGIETYKLAKGVDLGVGPRNRLSVASQYEDCA